MAPTLNATIMAEKNDTQVSWLHKSFEINKNSDVLLATEHDLDLLNILPITVAILIGIPGNSYVCLLYTSPRPRDS